MNRIEYRPVPALDHLDKAAHTMDRTFKVIRDGEVVGTVRITAAMHGPVTTIMAEAHGGVTRAETDALGNQFADFLGTTVLKLEGQTDPSDRMN